jgi:uncharacterized protein (DUF2336 family)
MTSEAQLLIAELDATLRRTSVSRQLEMLRNVTNLFLVSAKYLSGDQTAVFDDVMGRLIEKTETHALVELSEKLAPLNNAPVNVISRLSSNDDISVSGPILEKSSLLNDQMLAEIAGTKRQNLLVAIAGRPQVSEIVTDVLVERGNSEVAHKVVANTGASISELGFVKLIGHAKNDKTLAAAIADRKDLPPELIPFLKLALA